MALIRWLLALLGYRLVKRERGKRRTVYVPSGAIIHTRPE